MSYHRVIPRDLFNEANLMKCYAKIYINLEKMNVDASLEMNSGNSFQVEMNPDSGHTYIENIDFIVNDEVITLLRPHNSREDWPLYMVDEDYNEISIFDDNGEFSEEMKEFLEQYPRKTLTKPPLMEI